MKRYWVKLAVLGLLLSAVTACGPVYQKEYRFTTPPTEEGRICANSCLDKMNACMANCRSAQADCRHLASLEAENSYLRYVNERQRENKPVERDKSSFLNYSACNNQCENQCHYSHRICHSNCGGNVVEHTYCSAFCD